MDTQDPRLYGCTLDTEKDGFGLKIDLKSPYIAVNVALRHTYFRIRK